MPAVLTLILMIAVAYSFVKEGVFTAFCMLVNVLVSGLVAFNWYEPVASFLEPMFPEGLGGYVDAVSLLALFAGMLALLRSALNSLVNSEITYHPLLFQIGAGFFGLVTGYLLAGFLFCLFQTLPWHENFMNFDPKVLDPADPNAALRRVLPPDRVWLAMMQRASKCAFSAGGEAFDKDSSFEFRYARYRRYNDTREAMTYYGELAPPPPEPEAAPQ